MSTTLISVYGNILRTRQKGGECARRLNKLLRKYGYENLDRRTPSKVRRRVKKHVKEWVKQLNRETTLYEVADRLPCSIQEADMTRNMINNHNYVD